MNELHKPVGAIFDAAIELPPERRAAYVQEVCAGDDALRQRVEDLLRAHESAESFMNRPAVDASRKTPDARSAQAPGDRIGRYKLLEPIGEGGCGVVYMAEQEEPVHRRVALKVIKLGMDTKQVIARFEAERQALALMDHPNIAKVLEAGTTDSGRPYFVMELVRGIKITDFCDQNNLSTRERLNLFSQVCGAIQHAHQKGIIHRDIKPSNILVTVNDGVPVPMVIDFGIAKSTQGRLTDQTLFTAFEQFLGTPAYMSPEQAVMTNLDIDTRSDIYSLGVLLYELLTGKTPFDATELLAAGLDEMRRTIREKEPARPSTCLSTMQAADVTSAATRRQTDASKLIHALQGDVDWIVMKALEKDRARRYETANGLAMDIQRHLDDEPVLARPPSRLYLFQKLVRRNKLAFAAAAVASASLMVGLGVSTLAAFRFQRAGEQVRKAKDDAMEKLRASYLTEARADRSSGRAGQRFASLDAVTKAAAIRTGLDARDETIACLAVSDVRLLKQVALRSTNLDPQVRLDANLEQYAIEEGQGTITIRALLDDHEIMRLPGPGFAVAYFFGFSPDRRFFAVGYANDTVWVWDLTKQSPALSGLSGRRAGDFSPDGRVFALSTPEGDLCFHDLSFGRQARRLVVKKRFDLLAFDPKGTRLACAPSGNEPNLQIRDVESGQVVSTCPVDAGCAAWSPDGKLLATGCYDGRVYLWDPKDGRKVGTLEGPNDYILSVAFSHTGDLLASSSVDDDLRLWNPNTGRQIVSFAGSAYGIHFSPDDQRLAVLQHGSQLGVLAVVQSPEYRRLSPPAVGGRDHSGPDFSPDGRIIAAGTGDLVCFWDTLTGKQIAFVQAGPCESVLFHPDGKSLITSERAGLYSRPFQRLADPSRWGYKLAGPRRLYDAPDPRSVDLSRDGRHLAVVANHLEGESVILDLEDPSATVVLRTHPLVDYIAISPDARWVATASYQNSIVKVWDARSGQSVRNLEMPARTRITFSPDGRWLATFSTDYQLWEVGTWQKRNVAFPGHSLPRLTFLAFSPDTSVTAIVQEGRRIQLLDTLTGRPLANLEAPDAANIASLRFSPDGSQLAALEQNQRLQLWDLRLIRKQLQQVKLDWSLPPYHEADTALSKGRVILEVDPGAEVSPFITPELARSIPVRDDRAKTNLIDLTSYYNASLIAHSDFAPGGFRDLPIGIQTLAGVQFDVRGLIQVGAESPTGPKYPTQVSNIPLGYTCQRLHFLHGAIFGASATNGTRVGSYVIHYANDRRAEVPIIVGESLADGSTTKPNDHESFTLAWGAQHAELQRAGLLTYLFKSTWQNPFPADAIASIDFVSNPPGPAPYLVAITADP